MNEEIVYPVKTGECLYRDEQGSLILAETFIENEEGLTDTKITVIEQSELLETIEVIENNIAYIVEKYAYNGNIVAELWKMKESFVEETVKEEEVV